MVTILKLKQQSNIIYVHFISWTFSVLLQAIIQVPATSEIKHANILSAIPEGCSKKFKNISIQENRLWDVRDC